MTHEEFLSKITHAICCSGIHEIALRAIVDLHKPIDDSEVELCQECTRISSTRIKYPCPTIRTAQEELW